MKLLYFDSLNEHMKKYMDDVKINDINDSLQAQKIKLLRQIELSNISQAEAANKLEELKKIAIALKSNEVAPFSKTTAPELKQSIRSEGIPSEEYSPLTATRYEKAIQNKMTLTKKHGVYKNQSLIDELKEKLQKRNQTLINPEIFKEANVREVNKTIDGLITGMIERGKQLEQRKQDIAEMKKADKEAISSSKASTASSQADLLDVGKPNFNTVKKDLKNKYIKDFKLTEKEANKRIDNELSSIAKNKKIAYMNSIISGSGLSQRKFRSKRIL